MKYHAYLSSSMHNNVRSYKRATTYPMLVSRILLDTRVLFLLPNVVLSFLYRESFDEKRNLCGRFTISNPIAPLDRSTHQQCHAQKRCAYDPDRLIKVMSRL